MCVASASMSSTAGTPTGWRVNASHGPTRSLNSPKPNQGEVMVGGCLTVTAGSLFAVFVTRQSRLSHFPLFVGVQNTPEPSSIAPAAARKIQDHRTSHSQQTDRFLPLPLGTSGYIPNRCSIPCTQLQLSYIFKVPRTCEKCGMRRPPFRGSLPPPLMRAPSETRNFHNNFRPCSPQEGATGHTEAGRCKVG